MRGYTKVRMVHLIIHYVGMWSITVKMLLLNIEVEVSFLATWKHSCGVFFLALKRKTVDITQNPPES